MGVTHHGRTQRLDLADPTLREWESTVLAADAEQGIVLDRSAFYPGGGGQPPGATRSHRPARR
jgi:misacylated tRNA(Ala) deacylase